MQKLLIASILGALALTGCSKDTTTTTPTAPIKTEHAKKDHKHKHHHDKTKHHHDKMKKGHHFFVCDKDTKVAVHHAHQNGVIKLNVIAPSLQLDNQEIELKLAPSASGERYINDANPASIYEWHSNGRDSIFGVTVKGKTYEYQCQAAKPNKRR